MWWVPRRLIPPCLILCVLWATNLVPCSVGPSVLLHLISVCVTLSWTVLVRLATLLLVIAIAMLNPLATVTSLSGRCMTTCVAL